MISFSSRTAGALQQYTFAMNGLYDPNLTGTGSQPRYFDTLCGRTPPPRRTVRTSSRRPDEGDGLRPRSRFSGASSVVAISGIAGTSTGPLRSRNRCSATTRTTGYSPTLRRWQADRHSLSDLRGAPTLGVKDIEDANGTNAAYSANPTNLAHFVVTVAPLNQSTAPVINLNVETDTGSSSTP